ncbi:MAG: hypothetical protein ACKPKO_58035, partial [Candidatus Fonsibacter sp.]
SIVAPVLTGLSSGSAFAEAVVPIFEAENPALRQGAIKLVVPEEFDSVNAYVVQLNRKCLGGSYRESSIISQRDLFSAFLDRFAGMPEVMVGQARSASAPHREACTLTPLESQRHG